MDGFVVPDLCLASVCVSGFERDKLQGVFVEWFVGVAVSIMFALLLKRYLPHVASAVFGGR